MILRTFALIATTGAAVALAGCNASPPPPQAAAPQSRYVSPVTPSGFRLPEGSGCSGAIARYRSIVANDHDTGNVNDSVYKQIEGEIAHASAACAAGKDGESMALVHASERRHGYPGSS